MSVSKLRPGIERKNSSRMLFQNMPTLFFCQLMFERKQKHLIGLLFIEFPFLFLDEGGVSTVYLLPSTNKGIGYLGTPRFGQMRSCYCYCLRSDFAITCRSHYLG